MTRKTRSRTPKKVTPLAKACGMERDPGSLTAAELEQAIQKQASEPLPSEELQAIRERALELVPDEVSDFRIGLAILDRLRLLAEVNRVRAVVAALRISADRVEAGGTEVAIRLAQSMRKMANMLDGIV